MFSLCTFLYEGKETVGMVVAEQVYPLGELLGLLADPVAKAPTSMRRLLQRWDELLPACRKAAEIAGTTTDAAASLPLTQAKLLAPVPDPGKVINAGLNHRDHAEEMGIALPDEGFRPNFFFKGDRHCILGPQGTVRLSSDTVDWEGELAVVIGRSCRGVGAAEALDHIAGYTCHNDVTDRGAMMRPDGSLDFLGGKSRDTFAPLGPVLVPREQVAGVRSLRVKLFVNGEQMQDFGCDGLLWGPGECVAYLSSLVTLQPGDVIALGTGAGVGWAKGIAPGPRSFPGVLAHFHGGGGRFLRPGDQVAVDIAGIGRLEHAVE